MANPSGGGPDSCLPLAVCPNRKPAGRGPYGGVDIPRLRSLAGRGLFNGGDVPHLSRPAVSIGRSPRALRLNASPPSPCRNVDNNLPREMEAGAAAGDNGSVSCVRDIKIILPCIYIHHPHHHSSSSSSTDNEEARHGQFQVPLHLAVLRVRRPGSLPVRI